MRLPSERRQSAIGFGARRRVATPGRVASSEPGPPTFETGQAIELFRDPTNVAVAVARLGHRSAVITKVGDDGFGTYVREALAGFDGTWVAHPDLVATATEAFDTVLGERPNQLEKQRPEVAVTSAQLIDMKVPDSSITENGLRLDVSVGIQYIESWLRGVGAAAINNLMEDVATAEISRSQVWQWIRHASRLSEGPRVTDDLVREIADDELAKVRERLGEELWAKGRFAEARKVFEEVALSESFPAFLTLVAQRHID
jgi:malate synthase